ncbi:tetratricopeptide repeat protein [Streptococcus gallolyticus]|uniref:tetratricopeptide repeat protein n=1 Tax=Streptococcus gallolyticus TaxID=315405 RepID=UPI000884545C|nr:tetratricopeptide repeat protein [Streptococcus gallolyticus]SDJ61791.1 hypothetical protein SAMN04487842_0268 [Streptococcus gallolyticus]SDL10172.1 hypothetical protein SAMN04487841_0268 [Streptococcus gallolyticus]
MLFAVFLGCHLIIVASFFLVAKTIQLDFYLKSLLVFLPLIGAISVLYILKDRKSRFVDGELAFEKVIPWLIDDTVEQNQLEMKENVMLDITNIVPFQEALLLNNSGIKRELIIDVIFESPDQFVPLLHQARLNEDVEVVHYATTILSELTAKYDERLRQLEERVQKEPDSLEKRQKYADFLESYINSGIAEGHYGLTLQQTYIDEVEDLLAKGFLVEKSRLLTLAEIYQSLGDFASLERLLTKLFELFPDDQDIWMLKLDTIVLKKSSSDLTRFWQDLEQNHVYFSAENKAKLAFWQ